MSVKFQEMVQELQWDWERMGDEANFEERSLEILGQMAEALDGLNKEEILEDNDGSTLW